MGCMGTVRSQALQTLRVVLQLVLGHQDLLASHAVSTNWIVGCMAVRTEKGSRHANQPPCKEKSEQSSFEKNSRQTPHMNALGCFSSCSRVLRQSETPMSLLSRRSRSGEEVCWYIVKFLWRGFVRRAVLLVSLLLCRFATLLAGDVD
jgi:hypothetical protein